MTEYVLEVEDEVLVELPDDFAQLETAFVVDIGPQGIPGAGIPVGGTVGQVPVKASGDDYDISWGDAASSVADLTDVSLPASAVGNVLAVSAVDGGGIPTAWTVSDIATQVEFDAHTGAANHPYLDAVGQRWENTQYFSVSAILDNAYSSFQVGNLGANTNTRKFTLSSSAAGAKLAEWRSFPGQTADYLSLIDSANAVIANIKADGIVSHATHGEVGYLGRAQTWTATQTITGTEFAQGHFEVGNGTSGTRLQAGNGIVAPAARIKGWRSDIPVLRLAQNGAQTANSVELQDSAGALVTAIKETGALQFGPDATGLTLTPDSSSGLYTKLVIEDQGASTSVYGAPILELKSKDGIANRYLLKKSIGASANGVFETVAKGGSSSSVTQSAPNSNNGSWSETVIWGNKRWQNNYYGGTDPVWQFASSSSSANAGAPVFSLKTAPTQTANAIEVQDSTGTVLSAIEASGQLRTNNIRALSGSLNFLEDNGTACISITGAGGIRLSPLGSTVFAADRSAGENSASLYGSTGGRLSIQTSPDQPLKFFGTSSPVTQQGPVELRTALQNYGLLNTDLFAANENLVLSAQVDGNTGNTVQVMAGGTVRATSFEQVGTNGVPAGFYTRPASLSYMSSIILSSTMNARGGWVSDNASTPTFIAKMKAGQTANGIELLDSSDAVQFAVLPDGVLKDAGPNQVQISGPSGSKMRSNYGYSVAYTSSRYESYHGSYFGADNLTVMNYMKAAGGVGKTNLQMKLMAGHTGDPLQIVDSADALVANIKADGILSHATHGEAAYLGRAQTFTAEQNIAADTYLKFGSDDARISYSNAGSTDAFSLFIPKQMRVRAMGAGNVDTAIFHELSPALTMLARGGTIIPLAVKLHASQTANAFEVQDSAGTMLTSVEADGRVRVGTSALGSNDVARLSRPSTTRLTVQSIGNATSGLVLVSGVSSSLTIVHDVVTGSSITPMSTGLKIATAPSGQPISFFGAATVTQQGPVELRTALQNYGLLSTADFANATDPVLASRVVGDTGDRFVIDAGGTLAWKNGAGSTQWPQISYQGLTGLTFSDGVAGKGFDITGLNSTTPTFSAKSSASSIQFKANTATTIPLVAKLAASQTANAFEVQDSAGTVLASVEASGRLGLSTGASGGLRIGTTSQGVIRYNANGNGYLALGKAGERTIQIGSVAIAFFDTTPATQRPFIAAPTGGGVIDAEARTAIDSIRQLLIDYGLKAGV